MNTFSIIGTGFIFPSHAQAIRDVGGEICDVVNDARSDDTWREMLATTKAKHIVILTPNDLHHEMALTALRLGKTVLCEKPLCIRLEDVKTLAHRPNIFTVHQLRHHPIAKQLKQELDLSKHHTIEMDISVYRDPHYYESWKGRKERSGGVLRNLGIHYFDMLLHLFGMPDRVAVTSLDDKTGEGTIEGAGYFCRWRVSTGASKENARRVFSIDGTPYNFSSKENLAFENLHRFVYEDLLQNKGVTPQDTLPALELIENIYAAGVNRITTEQSFWNHPTSEIQESAIGEGTKIWQNSQILKGARIGTRCVIGHNCLVGSRAVLGNGVKLESNIDVWDMVTLEDYVFVGPSVVFTNDPTPRAKYLKSAYPEYGSWLPTRVKEGASIGANATIVCGVTIGKWAMVGAGAVVTKDVPDFGLVLGVPAKQAGWVCECAHRLEFLGDRAECAQCKRAYRREEHIILPL